MGLFLVDWNANTKILLLHLGLDRACFEFVVTAAVCNSWAGRGTTVNKCDPENVANVMWCRIMDVI